MRLATVAESRALLHGARRIAVLGIKPASRSDRAAHYIPEYLASVGYEILPVPVRYPEETHILGTRVHRALAEIGPVDIVSVFRRPEHQRAHLDDLLSCRPPVVWFQSGFMDLGVAQDLIDADITVVHACIGCRRAEIAPAVDPLPGQSHS